MFIVGQQVMLNKEGIRLRTNEMVNKMGTVVEDNGDTDWVKVWWQGIDSVWTEHKSFLMGV